MQQTTPTPAAKTNETRRNDIACELDLAVEVASRLDLSIGKLKQSEWYQSRKAMMRSLDQSIAARKDEIEHLEGRMAEDRAALAELDAALAA